MWKELCAIGREAVSRRPLLIGLLAALAAILFASGYLSQREAELARISEPAPVIVAARDIAPGEAIDDASIAMAQVPRRFLQPAAFAAVEAAAGRIAAIPIRRGAHLTPANARRPSEIGGVAALVPAGRRAVTFVIEEGAAAGVIRPNDAVDVLATFDLGSESSVRRTTLTIAEGLPVLAVGGDVADALPAPPASAGRAGLFGGAMVPPPSARAAAAVTLAATPAEAQALAFAEASGRVSLALRPFAEEGTGGRAPPTTIATIAGGHEELLPMKRGYREYRGK